MDPSNQWHLLVPGLLGPMPHWREVRQPRVPRLEALLRRADPEPAPGADPVATICQLFGLAPAAGGDWPSAPLCLLADGVDPGDRAWLHADPILLQPDMERIRVFDHRPLHIQPEEAEALAGLFNRHFGPEGWELLAPVPERWYLRGPGAATLHSPPLHQIVGRSLYPFLPAGPAGAPWRRMLNEIQMLFHPCAVNQRREREGHPPIGGLWLWGGGVLPRVGPVSWQGVRANAPLARGLARAFGVPLSPDMDGLPAPGRTLQVWDHCQPPVLDGDPEAWVEALEGLEPLLATLDRALAQGHLDSLCLYPGHGARYRLTPRTRHRFWRRARPLGVWLEQTAAESPVG